ncbi:hypothetical protein DdX_14639 [Ditylenchus destructor]|uniref:Uncharacterized protein n=1 Tax=Ditylenchus destructor TaxID=166010 RepID=A0AAD4MSV3_9BILA|nr:hypothetical protein DdX_14639 [Ditylenchus destructor]
MSYSTPPPYSSTTSNHFQPTPKLTKRPLNSGSILLEVVFDSYRSQTEMVWHFERKFALDWINDTIFDGSQLFRYLSHKPR